MDLFAWRHREGMSRLDVAKALTAQGFPVAENTVYRWETGRSRPWQPTRDAVEKLTGEAVKADSGWSGKPQCGGGRPRTRVPRI